MTATMSETIEALHDSHPHVDQTLNTTRIKKRWANSSFPPQHHHRCQYHCRRSRTTGAFGALPPFAPTGRAGTSASTPRSRCRSQFSTTIIMTTVAVGNMYTDTPSAVGPTSPERAHQPSRGHRQAGGHAQEVETRMLRQEKASLLRKLPGLERELGQQGRIESRRAGSTATDPPFQLLLGLFLEPELASHLFRRFFPRRCGTGRGAKKGPRGRRTNRISGSAALTHARLSSGRRGQGGLGAKLSCVRSLRAWYIQTRCIYRTSADSIYTCFALRADRVCVRRLAQTVSSVHSVGEFTGENLN